MAEGWIRVHRSIFDSDAFGRAEKFSKREAFIWMISEAAWKDNKRLKRGQLVHSIRHMADVWGWPKSTVSDFIFALKKSDTIRTKPGHNRVVITICNYEEYQNDEGDARTQPGHNPDTIRTSKKKEEGKKEEKDTPNPVPTAEPLTDRAIPTHTFAPGEKTPDATVVDLNVAKPEKQYAYRGETFRITVKDFQKWRRHFWAVADLDGMLRRVDDYYADKRDNGEKIPKNVFMAVSGWLNNEHQKQVGRGAKMPNWLLRERRNDA